MSYGKAIVGSRNSGMQEMLDDGSAGLLYTPPDENELADHIIRILRNPELQNSLGAQAKQRALTVYNKDKIINETIAFYESAIAELRTKPTTHARFGRDDLNWPPKLGKGHRQQPLYPQTHSYYAQGVNDP